MCLVLKNLEYNFYKLQLTLSIFKKEDIILEQNANSSVIWIILI